MSALLSSGLVTTQMIADSQPKFMGSFVLRSFACLFKSLMLIELTSELDEGVIREETVVTGNGRFSVSIRDDCA